MRILIVAWAAGCLWGAGSPENRVDEIFAAYATPGTPGCAVGVLLKGETALSKGYGLADLEQNLSITPRSRFYMASVSKQFASVALLLAQQDGKLKLDDSIRKYIPELPAYADGITIRRMLDHTAGLRDYLSLWGMRGFSNESVLNEAPTLAMITRQQATNFPPGTDYSYSNTGYLLAAIALQRATGKTLSEFAQQRIYAPLEMTSSRFQADHSLPIPDRAHGYTKRDGWRLADVGFNMVGSGGMYSNVVDMLKWARNFEKPVVGGAVLAELQTPGKLVDGRPTPGGYALGMIEKDGTYGHSGGATGYSTYFLRVPKHGVTVVCLCNVGGAPVERLARSVAAVYSGDPVPPSDPPSPAARTVVPWADGELARLAGSYWSEELHAVWTMAEREGRLVLVMDGGEVSVAPLGGKKYRAGDMDVTLADEKDGRASAISASVGRARGIRFVRR